MKQIRTSSDLAINGAPPAFAEPLHVGRPNIGDRAAFLQRIGQILDTCRLTNNGPMVQEFERRIAEYLCVKHCVAMRNGTAIKRGARVGKGHVLVFVDYVPIKAAQRVGKRHIKSLRDGLHLLLFIFKIATLYSPLKLFVPAAFTFFLFEVGYYGYTFVIMHRLTNMSTLLFSAAVIVFLIRLISEQITALASRRHD